MYSENLTIYAVAVMAFILSFGGFYYLSLRNEELAPRKNAPFVIIFPILSLSFAFLFYQISNQQDFIYNLSWANILLPLLGSALIYVSWRFVRSAHIATLMMFFCSASAYFFQPDEFSIASTIAPWLSGLLLCLGLFFFTFFYPYISGIDGILGLQTASIGLGIFALSLLGGVPTLLGGFGLSLGAIFCAFLIFNWYPAKLSLTKGGAHAIGFIIGWLMLCGTYEGSGPAVIIFAMFFVVEILSALLKKMTLRPEYANLTANTNCYEANLSGFPPSSISANIFRLLLILLMMGCFELYAPNAYTIPLFTMVVTIWYLSKIKNWQTSGKTIRELNQDLMIEIKNNLNNVKNQINKEK